MNTAPANNSLEQTGDSAPEQEKSGMGCIGVALEESIPGRSTRSR
jgi:hypothetical protein